ncbi:MAG TPA: NUDIX domain-containing protein [Armatimonadota bacterium]|nr:NUDIX domain-containing protein [Armatimonadota bacterium]
MKQRRELVSAGAVVVRRGPSGKRVLLLHHAGLDEWRLPKGKLKAGESAARAAEREVAEEAGVSLRAGRLLGTTSYSYDEPDGSRAHKIVCFFDMSAGEGLQVTLEHTFDAHAWLTPREAMRRLTWDNEAEMVARATAIG